MLCSHAPLRRACAMRRRHVLRLTWPIVRSLRVPVAVPVPVLLHSVLQSHAVQRSEGCLRRQSRPRSAGRVQFYHAVSLSSQVRFCRAQAPVRCATSTTPVVLFRVVQEPHSSLGLWHWLCAPKRWRWSALQMCLRVSASECCTDPAAPPHVHGATTWPGTSAPTASTFRGRKCSAASTACCDAGLRARQGRTAHPCLDSAHGRKRRDGLDAT